ncbi:helix-turn-helix domain-containing protein [Maribellus luteus]|uniref:histidine kinase n=1 Tax=Maribellus luteus TaxID=2305463 RepID=A0A399SYQ8_9BACT|nr:ATP-binding protein [Maribellus luteus]RIJ49136.1 helix-turn-helix domain-containing protein [Maribellus luteus]
MSSTFLFFDKLDAKLEGIIGRQHLSYTEEVAKKYMLTQGAVAITGLSMVLVLSWIIGAKMLAEFCLVYIPFMFVASYLFFRARKMSLLIFVFKIAMILISSIYIIRMGGLLTCGGLFLFSIQAVTSTVILRDLRKIITVSIIFAVVMILLVVFEPLFPVRYALNPQQNAIAFAASIVLITGYIFFFSLYATNLYAKQEQRETQRQKELNDAKTRLYTNITHEFRTPLTVILGLADTVKFGQQNHIEQKMDTIIRNGKNLLQLVDQMLDLSKVESGKLSVDMIHANIIPFLKYIFQLQEFYAEEKCINMSFFSDNLSYELDFDPEKTAAVVGNLLNNAIKYTSEGGNVQMKVMARSDSLYLEVCDDGIGIPSEKMERIFDRFYQVDDKNTRKAGGAGIGLALTRELVNLMNGTISVKSIAGEETVFTVQLPVRHEFKKAEFNLHKQTLESETNDTFNDVAEIGDGAKKRLEIVEDNTDVVAYMKACYERHFHIFVAKDGWEGYKLALDEVPDIIVSDVMMPGMDGFELCRKLKNDYRTSHIPVILLTAKADITSRIEGLEQGADAYVVKPFNQLELLVRMQKLLELRRNLFRRYSNGNGMEFSSDPIIQREDAFFKRLNESINKNLGDEHYDIHKLCEDMAMSKSQLYRKFKALTNQSAAKYIRQVRMKKARELLQTSNMNITEVGYEVGMKSLSTFSQLFKDEFGESPRQFLNHQKVNGNGKLQ